jgi:prepilin-type N-terminal cleavage/methylation domain-containing protein
MGIRIRTIISSTRSGARGEDGFSLVELLVALVVFGIVLAAIYGIWFGLQRTYAFTEDDMRAQEQAREAMGEMVEMIRTARQPISPPSEDYRLTICEATKTSITFWCDVDRDANHDLELVQYLVGDGRTLWRKTWQDVSQPPDTVGLVSRWLTNAATAGDELFTYEDAKGLPCEFSTIDPNKLADPMDIRTITICLKVDIITDRAPITHVLTSVVQPRNMR